MGVWPRPFSGSPWLAPCCEGGGPPCLLRQHREKSCTQRATLKCRQHRLVLLGWGGQGCSLERQLFMHRETSGCLPHFRNTYGWVVPPTGPASLAYSSSRRKPRPLLVRSLGNPSPTLTFSPCNLCHHPGFLSGTLTTKSADVTSYHPSSL